MKKVIVGLVVLMMLLLRTLSFAEGKNNVGGITLEQAVEIAKKEVPGKVLEAEFEEGFYEVKIKA